MGGLGQRSSLRVRGRRRTETPESATASALPNLKLGKEDLGEKGFDLIALYNVGMRKVNEKLAREGPVVPRFAGRYLLKADRKLPYS